MASKMQAKIDNVEYVPIGDGFSSKDSVDSSKTHSKNSRETFSSTGKDFDGRNDSEMESNITLRKENRELKIKKKEA